MTTKVKQSHSEQQAQAQFKSIKEMVEGLHSKDETKREDAVQTIQEDPLSVEVRSGWHTPGQAEPEIAEYMILLCTGGPACRIIGTLGRFNEPDSAHIEHQDWGTPWTEYRLDSEEENIVLEYVRQFYFGD